MFGRKRHELMLVGVIIASTVPVNYAAAQGSCVTVNRRPGICIPILQCKFIEQILRTAPKPLPFSVTQYLRQSHCGTFNGEHYACCDQKRADVSSVAPRAPEVRPGVAPSEQLSRTGMSVLNPKILKCRFEVANGQRAELSEYPFLALLVYSDGVKKSLECGGSLISSRHVLPAAHCILVRQPKKLVAARLGEYDIDSEVDCTQVNNVRKCAPPVQEIDIAEAIYHKDYTANRFANDIGLLRLQREAVYNGAVLPICMPTASRYLPKELVVVGWGNTEHGIRASVLQEAFLPVVKKDTCQNLYRVIPITDKHVCAGGVNETQSCRGDSGGPLIKKSGYTQFGIVSGGSRKCGTNFPDVYTRVSAFLPWISSNIAALM